MEILLIQRHDGPYRDDRSRDSDAQDDRVLRTQGKASSEGGLPRARVVRRLPRFVKEEEDLWRRCARPPATAPPGPLDTWRICEFAEILGFYGLQYWYTWQVSVLGLARSG